MKKIFFFLLAVILVSCSQDYKNLDKYEIDNSIVFSTPKTLELRDDNSEIGKIVSDFRDEYNTNEIRKMEKSKVVLQPKGTNELKKEAIEDNTRVIINIHKIKNSFVGTDYNIKEEVLKEWEELLRSEIEGSINIFSNTGMLEWLPIESGKINNQFYIRVSYVMKTELKSYKMITYEFFNRDEKVEINLGTSIPVSEEWQNTFNIIVNSFRFKNKKISNYD